MYYDSEVNVWRTDGLSTVYNSDNSFTCVTYHLTNFSLLNTPPARTSSPVVSLPPSTTSDYTAIIIGAAVGGIAFIAIALLAIFIYIRKKV